MEGSIMDFAEMTKGARRGLENQRDRLTEQMEQIADYLQLMDCMDELIGENEKMHDETETLKQQLDDEKKRNADLEMKLAEMGKLSAGVAMKASEEAMLKALRTYVNRSKRKTLDKRAFAKTAILEISNANGLLLPEELAAAIDSLDDEQTEPKTVVNGDIVIEKNVVNKK